MSNNIDKITLEDLGYNEFFNHQCSLDKDLVPARVIAEHKETYILRNENAEFSAKITGKMMHEATHREDYPAVGDWVLVSNLDEEQSIIHEILPRKTILKRKVSGKSDMQIIASNIDTVFIVQSVDRDYSLNRLERYFSVAKTGNMKHVIILNKTDLTTEEDLEAKITEIRDRFKDIVIYATSIITEKGVSDLRASIVKGCTYCFVGSSGVGKSSLINTLRGNNFIKTAEIGLQTQRGKHITTHRELFVMESGGLLIDNPGMREIGLLDSEGSIGNVFPEILELSEKCSFQNCTHIHESGCVVLEAVNSGDLDRNRYDNYIKLVRENEYNNMSKLEKREKDRKFGKYIKQAKKQIKKFKY